MIEWRSHYGDWQEVSPERALKLVQSERDGISTGSSKEEKDLLIERYHLRGTTVKDLEEMARQWKR